MRSQCGWFVCSFALLASACGEGEPYVGQERVAVTASGACSVAAGGTLTSGDTAAGSASEVGAEAGGHWVHLTAAGDHLICEATIIDCSTDGGGGPGQPGDVYNVALLELDCTLNGTPGFQAGVFVADRGEPNTRDEYGISVVAPDGTVVFENVDELFETGNVQIKTL